MGNLPPARIRPQNAFTSVGIDYAEPLNISLSKGRGRTLVMGYIAVFDCLVTKAIHLEPVGDFTADAFIGALNRFIGRRGKCVHIKSDFCTNFVGANRKLQADQLASKLYIEKLFLVGWLMTVLRGILTLPPLHILEDCGIRALSQ